jgi:hypothetical protein
MILLTSFKKSLTLPADYSKFSIAVYQPKGFNYPKLPWFDIRENGRWIRPREFLSETEPLVGYREKLLEHFYKDAPEIKSWYWNQTGGDMAFCCWCPYEKAAQRQIRQFGSFVCHTGVVYGALQYMGIPVELDEDRKERMNKLWT